MAELALDMSNICRICLEASDAYMISIYDSNEDTNQGEAISICEKIEHFSGIKINRTLELPSRICSKCKAFLSLAHKFWQICQRSNEFLREYVYKDQNQSDQQYQDQSDQQHEEQPDAEQQYQHVEEHQESHEHHQPNYEELEVEVLDEGIWADDNAIAASPTTTMIALKREKESTMPTTTPDAGKLHICELCGNSYPRKSTLDTHMRRHRNERPYKCDVCPKAFYVNYQLTRHIRQHTGARPYSCEYCERKFTDRSSQVKHERTHRNERPYKCATCDKSFTYASVLKAHYKTHTGEKPHICQICRKSFARTHNLVAHLQTQQHVNDPRTAAYLRSLKSASTSVVNTG